MCGSHLHTLSIIFPQEKTTLRQPMLIRQSVSITPTVVPSTIPYYDVGDVVDY